jgi:hypothetical protein
LHGLESACCFQAASKGEKIEGKHRFQNIELGDNDLQDSQDTLQGELGPWVITGFQKRLQSVQFVQKLFEPQLVSLVDDDKEHLIVNFPVRQGLLERQEVIEFKVTCVRQCHSDLPIGNTVCSMFC